MRKRDLKAEVAAIETLRGYSPEIGARTFATRIFKRDFISVYCIHMAIAVGPRTFASIYGVIRRYDARQKAKNPLLPASV